jgi:hypothetical protein
MDTHEKFPNNGFTFIDFKELLVSSDKEFPRQHCSLNGIVDTQFPPPAQIAQIANRTRRPSPRLEDVSLIVLTFPLTSIPISCKKLSLDYSNTLSNIIK